MVEPIDGIFKSKYDDLTDEEWQAKMDAEDSAPYRIEALRAASRVIQDNTNPHLDDIASNTIHIAEQFAKWLESGKR